MKWHFGANLDYLLAVNGIGYTFLFLLLMIWTRLLLIVIKDGVKLRKRFSHKFVHPLGDPSYL
jgi:hypothetical protein